MFQAKICRENQNTHFMFNSSCLKIMLFMGQREKMWYSQTDHMIIQCCVEKLRFAWWITKACMQTPNCNIYYLQLLNCFMQSALVKCCTARLTKTATLRNDLPDTAVQPNCACAGVLISPQPDLTEKTNERSPFFIRRGGHCYRGDLVGRTTFLFFFPPLSGFQKLEFGRCSLFPSWLG